MSSETPGRLLSAAREAQSLSQADIAKQTRLSLQAINDIESDVYDRFGAATFVRGYLRSYARAVGISDEKILAAWEATGSGSALISPAPAVLDGVASAAANNVNNQVTSGAPSRTVLVIGALVVLSAIVWWENQKTPVVVVNTAEVMQKPVAVLPSPSVPVQVAMQAKAFAAQLTAAPKVVKNEKPAEKNSHKHHAVVAHHSAEPMHVTYTLKPVSPTELASVDH